MIFVQILIVSVTVVVVAVQEGTSNIPLLRPVGPCRLRIPIGCHAHIDVHSEPFPPQLPQDCDTLVEETQ